MTASYLSYSLRNGYIDHWLAAGPYAMRIPDLEPFDADQLPVQIVRAYTMPLESGPAAVEGTEQIIHDVPIPWKAVACDEDHRLDLSTQCASWSYLQCWAYAEVASPAAQDTLLTLSVNGPADLWINGRHLYRQEAFYGSVAGEHSVAARLEKGWNQICVRLEMAAVGPTPCSLSLRIGSPATEPADDEAGVRLPTALPDPEKRLRLERLFARAYLDRDVYTAQDEIAVHWPVDLAQSGLVHLRLQDQSGPIFLELRDRPEPAASTRLGRAAQVPDGRYQVTLMSLPEEYYVRKLRVQRALRFHVVNGAYSQQLYGTDEQRRAEALQHAALQKGQLFAEIAKMALGQWNRVSHATIRQAIERIEARDQASALDLLGLITIAYRYRRKAALPQELLAALEASILHFDWRDIWSQATAGVSAEGRALLLHAAELLAGQLYYDRRFAKSGRSGKWHREQAEQWALAWLERCGMYGFAGWGSQTQLCESMIALAHLVEGARTTQVQEMAAVVLDKLLFSLALNSYRGTFGASHSNGETAQIKNGRLHATAGISRLLWGMGVYNQHIAGPVSLALAEAYELPSIIQAIAVDLAADVWTRERHAGQPGQREVNRVAYRTADYLLASAQDYRPGEPGDQQHIWQATLGPDAVVFTNHPACASESDAYRPNCWRGNRVLPRVAQWKDVLIALYHLPEHDALGYTHAYFPLYSFDETQLRAGWAFARKGDGYVALRASQEFTLITQGEQAYRELRAPGQHHVWLCHMGQAASDGSFANFQEKILALPVEFGPLSVRCATLRGETLAFGWEGTLQVDGASQPITGFKHHDSLYGEAELPARDMTIRYREHAVRLHFALDDK